jgi:hypothetical protein
MEGVKTGAASPEDGSPVVVYYDPHPGEMQLVYALHDLQVIRRAMAELFRGWVGYNGPEAVVMACIGVVETRLAEGREGRKKLEKEVAEAAKSARGQTFTTRGVTDLFAHPMPAEVDHDPVPYTVTYHLGDGEGAPLCGANRQGMDCMSTVVEDPRVVTCRECLRKVVGSPPFAVVHHGAPGGSTRCGHARPHDGKHADIEQVTCPVCLHMDRHARVNNLQGVIEEWKRDHANIMAKYEQSSAEVAKLRADLDNVRARS